MKITTWEDTDKKGFHAKCEYDSETRNYTVTVSKDGKELSESFRAGWEPRFGMDVVDIYEALAVAERLAIKLENQLRE